MMLLLLLALVRSAIAVSNPACQSLPTDTTASASSIQQFTAVKYTHLIIGGGTAGLVLANRLSERSSNVVGVIEAGIFHQDDPNIDIPGLRPSFHLIALFGNSSQGNGNSFTAGNASYDWLFQTVPQAGANGRQIAVTRGKILGGSSGLNGMAWTRASKLDYDAWQTITSSSQWNWNSLLKYFQKCATTVRNQFDPFPGFTQQALSVAANQEPTFEGLSGPINASINTFYSDIIAPYVQTVNAVGIPTNANEDDGSGNNIYNARRSVDIVEGVRSYAANRYYCEASFRSNLKVLTGAQVTKILFSHSSNTSDAVATGAVFQAGSQTYTVNATQEVILSAGAIQSPQILELSGIGNSSLLQSYGIQSFIDLPGVGQNLQEHPFVPVEILLTPGHHTFDELRNNATFAAEQQALYNTNRTGALAATDSALTFVPFSSFLPSSKTQSYIQLLTASSSGQTLNGLQKNQFGVLNQWLKDGIVPQIELLPFTKGFIDPLPGDSYVTILVGLAHVSSRGSVHLNTSDPLAAPLIDFQMLSTDYDVQALLDTVKFALNLTSVSPLKENTQNVTSPITQNDDELIQYIRYTVGPGFHPCCTASIGPKALGGVVDENLIVYGTKNLRVVDASVMPMLVGAHLQETIYGIAEKLADIIN
ncbi:alcohol oxidase [Mycena floridula]|nr:alcohol oxidase [Mycena floridula]